MLLCRYSDSPTPSSKTKAHFEGLFALLDQYYDEVTYGEVDLSYAVFDWQTMGPRADYGTVPADGVNMNETKLAQDCGDAHDANVNFSQFQGVDVILDQDAGFDATGVGGVDCGVAWDEPLGDPGCTKLTWIPADEAAEDGNGLALWAHEVGHSFGLPHAQREAGTQYWDPMGFPCGWAFVNGEDLDDTYGCFPVHYLAAHKTAPFENWIPGSRRATVKSGKAMTVKLERSAQPADNNNDLIMKAPVKGSPRLCYPGGPKNCGTYYSAEARMEVAGSQFDNPKNLPGDGVVISKVFPTCPFGEPGQCQFDYQPVQVQTRDGQADDVSSLWKPGEAFKEAGIKIKVLDDLAQGFKIKVTNNS